ncbi:hypothetical protein CBR_g6672 [Chara braunii]|uniref:Uncharacterized protein n=1 Tax=Chara braunii TaxID=69332 RepID=A0A388KKJ3_CHABU|nr:hypothetical protein CBR_g6672 [Chara braunii]|eukprot:GBG70546.1 hypothetical protein CBR_g6672 [Chara braunii]
MLRQQEGVEIDGGAILMDQWLEDRTLEMLDIMWELEEGSNPWLDSYIDKRLADDRMGACKTLFTLGHNLRNQLENRQRNGEMGDMGDKGDKDDGLEGGLEDGEYDCGDNTNNSNNINYSGIKDSDKLACHNKNGCGNNNSNNDNSNNNINNNNNNNGNINSNDDDDSSDDYGSSGVDSGVRAAVIIIDMMGEMPQPDVGEIGVGTEKGFAIFPPLNDSDDDDDNNNNNNSNNNNNNSSNNNNNGGDDQGSSGVGSGSASEIIISAMGVMLQAEVVGYGVDMETWFTASPPPLHPQYGIPPHGSAEDRSRIAGGD